jgi:adenosylcobinamide-GDP ribazoletransferase
LYSSGMTEAPATDAAPSSGDATPSSPSTASSHTDVSTGLVAHSASRVLSALRFYARLPVPVLRFEPAPYAPLDFGQAPPAIAIAGALIGVVPAIVLALTAWLGMAPVLVALLSLTALVLTTGALHEDGLADTADGLGGGATPARRLDIMRDSCIGSYGAIALMLSLALRATALAGVVGTFGITAACMSVIAVASVSRVAGLLPMFLLAPARRDGAAALAGQLTSGAMLAGSAVAAGLAGLCCWSGGISPAAVAVSVLAAGAAAYSVSRVAGRMIGGHTGDIAGAAQQVAEVAMLVVLAAAGSPQWLLVVPA